MPPQGLMLAAALFYIARARPQLGGQATKMRHYFAGHLLKTVQEARRQEGNITWWAGEGGGAGSPRGPEGRERRCACACTRAPEARLCCGAVDTRRASHVIAWPSWLLAGWPPHHTAARAPRPPAFSPRRRRADPSCVPMVGEVFPWEAAARQGPLAEVLRRAEQLLRRAMEDDERVLRGEAPPPPP